jgi:hypothetical protein
MINDREKEEKAKETEKVKEEGNGKGKEVHWENANQGHRADEGLSVDDDEPCLDELL